MWIYLITNLVNGKLYVGQTRCQKLHRRWNNHLQKARAGAVSPLYASIRKYGEAAFRCEEICWCADRDSLDYCERVIIELLQTRVRRFGYNVAVGGRSTQMTDEGRKRLSELMKRRNPMKNPEIAARAHAKNPHLGHNESWRGAGNPIHKHGSPTKRPEVAAKISASLTGRTFSAEHRANLSKSIRGHIPWNKKVRL